MNKTHIKDMLSLTLELGSSQNSTLQSLKEGFDQGKLPLLWDLKSPAVIRVDDPPADAFPISIIGDIHGDFPAMHLIFSEILRKNPSGWIIFLGDLPDRGPWDSACFLYFLDLVRRHPHRIGWIAGNHDAALSFDAEKGVFKSSVEPCEFCDWLNTPEADGEAVSQKRELGLLFIKVVSSLPRAVSLSKKNLLTHGGFPLEDLWDSLSSFEGLLDKKCLKDFVWTRATRYRHKIPNRDSTSCSYGFNDLKGFRDRVSAFLPFDRLIKGHDHVENGLFDNPTYVDVPMITLNSFSFHHAYEAPARFEHRKSELPYLSILADGTVVREKIPFPATDIHSLYNPNKEPLCLPQKSISSSS